MICQSCCSWFYRGLIALGHFLQPFVLLAMRLFWGYLFVTVGLQKLTNPAQMVQLLEAHHMPSPTFLAYLVGVVETLGGVCLIVGLASRFAALLLIIVTVEAFFLVNAPAIFQQIKSDPEAIVKAAPFNFFLTSLIVFAFGPGLFSLDALFKRRRCCTKTTEDKVE